MKHWQNIFLCIVLILISWSTYVKSVAEWANTEEGKKYFIEDRHEYTWLESLHECAKRNLSLVTLDSVEKNNDFVKLMKNRYGRGLDLWIGGSASTAENSMRKFVWASNGKTFQFAHWQEGEPNNLGGEQPCVHTWSISKDFRWADGQYHLKYGYICEETTSLYKCWGSL
ncbi:lectin subunit alpha-like [Lucilia sericata]|uniref:lectin subunit alpha-like n=1 Tax=Lucilia sericata TaxID=13632 RepID=UPI0018A7FB15|nr:lectin subunit alpha-like [Lucilia sericata]